MPKATSKSLQSDNESPDYVGLVRFLIEPLLDSPDSLSIDSEQSNNNQRVWIRLAFESADTGRIFGRSGRNIQAIRLLLETAATAVGQTVYLDIYGGLNTTPSPERSSPQEERSFNRDSGERRKGRPQRPEHPKPYGKPRF